MKLEIIGLPQSGKTTIFNAVTGGNTPTTASAGRIEVHTAVGHTGRARGQALGDVQAQEDHFRQGDVRGHRRPGRRQRKSGISGQLLNQLTQMDGFLLVARAFEEENVPHPAGSVDARRDVDSMLGELLINDLIAVERKLERLTEERKKGGTDKVINERQTVLFKRLHEALNANTPLRKLEYSAEEALAVVRAAHAKTDPDRVQPWGGTEGAGGEAGPPIGGTDGQARNGDRPAQPGRCRGLYEGVRHRGAELEQDDTSVV